MKLHLEKIADFFMFFFFTWKGIFCFSHKQPQYCFCIHISCLPDSECALQICSYADSNKQVDPWNPIVISGVRGLSLKTRRLVIWKIASLQVGFPNNCGGVVCSPSVKSHCLGELNLTQNKAGDWEMLCFQSAAVTFSSGCVECSLGILFTHNTGNNISCLYAAGQASL